MAIVKMKKFTLLAFESHEQELLKRLQAFQNVEFINLQDEEILEEDKELAELDKNTPDSTLAEYEDALSKAGYALEFLQRFEPTKKEAKKVHRRELTLDELEEKVISGDFGKHFKEIQGYEQVKDFDEKLKAIEQEKSQLKQEIDILEKWTGFNASFAQVNELKETTHLLGTISVKNETDFFEELSECNYVHSEVINRTARDVYLFLLIGAEEKNMVQEINKTYGFAPFVTNHEGTPTEIIENAQKRLIDLEVEEVTISERVQSLDGLIESFELAYEYYHNVITRQNAQSNFLKTDETILTSGWVPEELIGEAEEIIKDVTTGNYFLTFEDVTEDEVLEVPIQLRNNRIVSRFESLTKMFSLPKYNEIDPTPFLAPFYLIFFGMMVADIGYGLVVFVGTLLAQAFMNLTEKQREFLQFFFWLSIPTMLFGWLYGSFFGDMITMNSLIEPERDIQTLLVLSIAFGLVHIFVGLGIKGYLLVRIGKPLDAFFDAGSWIITVAGAVMFFADYMADISETLGTIGMWVMFAGMALVVLTQGREAKSIGGKIGGGLYALFGLTNYVGDIVSYTRLMALGLAGGSIASALNLIMRMFPGVAIFIVGPIFFVAAHSFNIFLGMLGAYVHSSRLQYVEYFGKFYEGGGKAFTPFKPLEKYVAIKEEE